MVPSMYSLMWEAEFVTFPSPPKTSKPHFEATSDPRCVRSRRGGPRRCVQHTEDLVAHVIFPDKISQEFLIDTSFVDNLPQPSTFCATTDKRKRLDSPPCPKRCIPAQLLSAAPVQPRRDWDGFLNQSSDPLPRSRGKGRENLQRGVSWPWWLNSKELPEHVRDRWPALSWWQRSPDWIDANARDRDPQIPCCCPVRA